METFLGGFIEVGLVSRVPWRRTTGSCVTTLVCFQWSPLNVDRAESRSHISECLSPLSAEIMLQFVEEVLGEGVKGHLQRPSMAGI